MTVKRAVMVAVALAMSGGIASAKSPIGATGLHLADTYARAVFVDHDCATAKRLSSLHGTSWTKCGDLQKTQWRYRIVQQSRRVHRACSPNPGDPLAPGTECVSYQIISLRHNSGLNGAKGTVFWYGIERLYPRKIEGAWILARADYSVSPCVDTDPPTKCPQRAQWERRIRLHTGAPLAP